MFYWRSHISSKDRECKNILFFYASSAYANMCLMQKKSSIVANAALVCFEYCASLHKSLYSQPNMGKLYCTSLDTC